MILKSVNRYVKYKNKYNILEIIDTQFDGDTMFSREYKVDEENNFYVGRRYHHVVNEYTCIGVFLEDSEVLVEEDLK